MPKVPKKLHVINELNAINKELIPLKELADRELVSIRGLTGMVYTPHIDEYMQVSIKKSEILVCLKEQKLVSISEVEIVTTALNSLHSRAKNNSIVEYEGKQYKRRFLPLKLSKSGKIVQRWAKFWLLLTLNGDVDEEWENKVREIWPKYFLIRAVEM